MTTSLEWHNRLRVRLTVDLTRYHPALVVGAEGVVTTFSGRDERFWRVRFPNAGEWDILPDGLEILDKEFLRWCDEEMRRRYERMIGQAKEGVWYLGPRGGYRGFYVNYERGCEPAHDRKEAEKIARMLEEHGIPIRKEKDV